MVPMFFQTLVQILSAADIVLTICEMKDVDVVHSRPWYIEKPHFAL